MTMQQLNDELSKAVGNTMVAAAIAVLFVFRDWLRRPRQKHIPHDAIHAHDLAINSCIQEAGIRLGAIRSYVGQYRNGEFYDSGNPVQRKSRTHEWRRDGIEGQAQSHRDMLVGLMADEYTLVKQDGASFTPVRDLPRGNFRALCEAEGAKAVARAAIRRGGNIVGFVGADFDVETPPPNVDELVRCADRVAFELASAVKAEV
jgi:hypothetical protein